MSSKLLLITAAAAALSACGTVNKPIGVEDAAFGEAVKYDTAVQTINRRRSTRKVARSRVTTATRARKRSSATAPIK